MPPEDQPYNKVHVQLAKVKTCLEDHQNSRSITEPGDLRYMISKLFFKRIRLNN